MPRVKSKVSFYQRHLIQVAELGIPYIAMRSCHQCVRLSKQCRVAEGSDKCVECLRGGCPCDLAPLDTARWRRLEKQRQKLKEELREANAKQQRLLRQLDYLEEEQQTMVDGELKNLEEMAPPSSFADSSLLSPLIDVASKQVVFPNTMGEWSFTSLVPFDGIAANDVGSASNSQ